MEDTQGILYFKENVSSEKTDILTLFQISQISVEYNMYYIYLVKKYSVSLSPVFSIVQIAFKLSFCCHK